MNDHVREFYRLDSQFGENSFKDVIFLRPDLDLGYDEICVKCPNFPRGYYELSHLGLKDRIEFIYSFWEKTLSFDLHVNQFFKDFFSRVEDIGIFLVRKEVDPDYQCHFIYSLDDDHTFYKAGPSADLQFLERLKGQFQESLPQDYINFFKIHDGFAKDGDLGLIPSRELLKERRTLQAKIQHLNGLFQEKKIDPEGLIPFYKTFGLDIYQCFIRDWYPEKEMGNTLFSLNEGYISDYNDSLSRSKNLAFPTFLDWLMFYMEVIDV